MCSCVQLGKLMGVLVKPADCKIVSVSSSDVWFPWCGWRECKVVSGPGVKVGGWYTVGRVSDGTLGRSRALTTRRDLYDVDEVSGR